uniref:Uncharacterized protein n=1 Tax=Pacific black duck aveparvovirus TaxID=2759420 RepID=A0A7D6WSF2_9VIRU|nr:hypothetical protein [Pacific black duck aveparvovirus]
MLSRASDASPRSPVTAASPCASTAAAGAPKKPKTSATPGNRTVKYTKSSVKVGDIAFP